MRRTRGRRRRRILPLSRIPAGLWLRSAARCGASPPHFIGKLKLKVSVSPPHFHARVERYGSVELDVSDPPIFGSGI
eukprot:8586638-Pyramimonas_sp.AAC.1